MKHPAIKVLQIIPVLCLGYVSTKVTYAIFIQNHLYIFESNDLSLSYQQRFRYVGRKFLDKNRDRFCIYYVISRCLFFRLNIVKESNEKDSFSQYTKISYSSDVILCCTVRLVSSFLNCHLMSLQSFAHSTILRSRDGL